VNGSSTSARRYPEREVQQQLRSQIELVASKTVMSTKKYKTSARCLRQTDRLFEQCLETNTKKDLVIIPAEPEQALGKFTKTKLSAEAQNLKLMLKLGLNAHGMECCATQPTRSWPDSTTRRIAVAHPKA